MIMIILLLPLIISKESTWRSVVEEFKREIFENLILIADEMRNRTMDEKEIK